MKSLRMRAASRFLALPVALVAVVPLIAMGSASAATPKPGPYWAVPADNSPIELAVVLTPSNRSSLRALAQKRAAASQRQRATAVAQTAPSVAARAKTRTALTAAGFTVIKEDAWTIRVTGQPALAERMFGVKLAGSGANRHPDRKLTIPASLGAVTTVIGLDQRPVMRRHVGPGTGPAGGYTPDELRAAYQLTASPSIAGAGTTVATVQFSGWNSNDLTVFRGQFGLTAPPLAQVSVDNANPAVSTGGDDEVALDQETILGAAPQASQRVYFAPNSLLGSYDAYTTIADDVAQFGITAVSSSWGFCETSAPVGFVDALNDTISRGVASGATAFAASGDFGSHDCGDPNSLDVDLPASLPSVVAVGGTSLTKPGAVWTETGWGPVSFTPNPPAGASGGGESISQVRPAYQQGLTLPGAGRLVPDISAVADPATGAAVYIASWGGWRRVGGTSLASPLAAGMLAATVGNRGCTQGIGDIHTALYAAGSATGFRDITSGTNGTASDPIHYSAGTGYDLVTGLGSPLWDQLGAALVPTSSVCPLTIRNSYLQTFEHVTVGVAYSKTLVATGGVGPYTWSLAPGSQILPPGLTLAPNGVLSGTPTIPSSPDPTTGYDFTIQVTDSATPTPATVQRDYNITVEAPNGRFVPVATARIFDQTVGTTNVAVPMPLSAPANATAVVMNVEVYQPSVAGYLRVTPYGKDAQVGNQEYVKGQIISNLVTVALNNSKAQVKVSAGTSRVLMDLSGYYVDDPGSVYNPLPTTRIFDQTVGKDAVTISMPAAVPAGATAVAFNVAIFAPTAAGYVRVTPLGQDAAVGVQEFVRGQTISNLVVVKLTGGAAQVKVSAGTARVLIDIAGYYSADPGSVFVPLPTSRIFDGPIGTGTVPILVGDNVVVPEWATAVVVNVEVFNPSANGYIRVTPYQYDAQVGTQQVLRGQTISNLVVVKLTGGYAQVKMSAGGARVLFDVAGYFA